MKVPSNYDSYLVFNLEQLFHRHLFVLGDPPGSVNASEAAAAAVLVEEDVVKLDVHEGAAGRRHLILALGTGSPSEGGRKGGESGSGSRREAKAGGRAASLWNTRVRGRHMTQTERRLCVAPWSPGRPHLLLPRSPGRPGPRRLSSAGKT